MKHNRQRGETKFPGIGRHSKELGCHRVHLHLVLTGARKSNRLVTAYKKLLREEGRAIPPTLGSVDS